MVAVLIAFPPSHMDLFGSVGTIAFASCILRQGEERLFQTRTGDFQARESRVPRQQLANDRLGLDRVKFDSIAIFSYFGHSRNLAQRIQAESGDAANALARSLRFDLRRSPLGNDFALVDDSDAVGKR